MNQRMSGRRFAILACPLVIMLASWSGTVAAWTPDPADRTQLRAAEAIEAFKERMPKTEMYFEQAYGYAILPKVGRIGFGLGGAYGRGIVIEQDEIVGSTKFYQFTSGIQAGLRSFSMIVFFKDKEALEYYKSSQLQFMGQAGVALATVGAGQAPAYNSGVALFTLTRVGLMAEATISGARYTYRPLE